MENLDTSILASYGYRRRSGTKNYRLGKSRGPRTRQIYSRSIWVNASERDVAFIWHLNNEKDELDMVFKFSMVIKYSSMQS